jgi:hypothetical protein
MAADRYCSVSIGSPEETPSVASPSRRHLIFGKKKKRETRYDEASIEQDRRQQQQQQQQPYHTRITKSDNNGFKGVLSRRGLEK